MYNMVTIADNTIVKIKFAKSLELKCSHQKPNQNNNNKKRLCVT